MVRTANVNDKHSGQISLPGGKRSFDETFAHTALRETTEELGINRPYLRLIRSLSPLYIPPSNFMFILMFHTPKKSEIYLTRVRSPRVDRTTSILTFRPS